MRLSAFVLVYLDHALPQSPSGIFYILREGGAFGVPVFFALSAYLITELLSREKAATGTVDLRSFYVRRILRIWPLYFFALSVVFILSRVIPGTHAVSIPILLANFFLIGNWPLAIHTEGALPLGFAVLWSLGIEEQFYLLWPGIARRCGRKALLIICALLWLVAQIIVVNLWLHSAPYHNGWFNTFVQMQYFALGSALSLVLNGRIPEFSALARFSLIAAGLLLFFCFPRSEALVTPLPYLSANIATACIVIGFLGMKLPSWTAPMQYLGKISYGLYVFHYPLLILTVYVLTKVLGFSHGLLFVRFAIGAPLTVLTAYASYNLLEKRFLIYKARFEVVRSRSPELTDTLASQDLTEPPYDPATANDSIGTATIA